jgi:hypothetical protein
MRLEVLTAAIMKITIFWNVILSALHNSYLKAVATLVTVYQATCQKALTFKETRIQDTNNKNFLAHYMKSTSCPVLLQLKAEHTNRLSVDSWFTETLFHM